MYSKSIVALAGVVALAEQAGAFSLHRHQHKMEKKALKIDYVTQYDTVYVTAGGASPQATPVQDAAVAPVVNVVPTINFAPAPAPQPTTLATAVKPQATGSSSSKSGSVGFSGKRGLAYNDPQLANTFGEGCKVCAWGYNWADTAGDLNQKYSFVPMLWGNKPDLISRWAGNAQNAISSGSKALFSINEPDNAGQAAMSPSDAADFHVQHMNPFSGKALIGAPAVSNSNLQGEGLDWLQSWVSTCESKGCKYDFCNVHWYSPASASDDLFNHIKKASQICGGKPVWLTEFAPQGSSDEVNSFINEVIPKLDAMPELDAYSYFMVGPDSLLSSVGGALSSIGQLYASLTS